MPYPVLSGCAANHRLRPALLHSVSLGALLVAGASPPQARAASQFRSLNQALALAGHAAQAAISPSNGVLASQHAALGAQNLARGASQFLSLSAALAAAAKATPSGSSPIVVDGYGPGTGLQAAARAASGNALWSGALTPDDPSNLGGIAATPSGVSVTVKQTAPLAQLTWKTFNVGAHTTLNFDQSAGGTLASSWVVINTVQDSLANGSEILGAIRAQGKVYVLNRNGIAFGAGSTINVGSLIAATADIAATQFSTTQSGLTSFNLYGAITTATNAKTNVTTFYQPSFVNGTSASITLAPGAAIETSAPTDTNGGGYVMLLGGNVANAGLIGTPQGQTILAGGTDFTLRQGYSGSVTAGNTTSTTLGSEIASTNVRSAGVFTTGSVVNSGLVASDQGDITLVGHALTQSGVLMSSTTVNQRGTIHLLTPNDGTDPTSSVTLAPGSLTEVLPENDGATELDSARQANVANSAILNASAGRQPGNEIGRAGTSGASGNPQLNNHDILADQLGESRVEISTGGSVDVGGGALVQVPGGQVAIGGGSQVVLEAGATLDVSGTTSAVLPASMNDLLVNVQPFQLRDTPADRVGPLKGTNVYVDERTLVEVASGAYAGNIYTPGGLIEVGGFIGQVPHGIEELTATGGQVTLQAVQHQYDYKTSSTLTSTLAGTIVTQPGSIINLQGGTVSYAAGPVDQTYVVAADGTVYDINDAPANLVFNGLYGGFTVDHARWQIVNVWNNALLTPAATNDPGYAVGRDAGGLVVNAGAAALQGDVYAGVTEGQYQTGPRPSTVADPYLLAQTVVPQAGSLSIGNTLAGVLQPVPSASDVVFQSTQGTAVSIIIPPAVSAAHSTSLTGTPATVVPGTLTIDAPALTDDGFATISLSTSGSITVAAPIAVADGGSVSLIGANIAVDSTITARSGTITLTDQLYQAPVAFKTQIGLAAGATLDARGVWTNAQLDPTHVAGLGDASGGTVSVIGAGGVNLAAGSTIDVSSGGAILAGGRALAGTGGSVDVVADVILPSASGAPTGSIGSGDPGAVHEDAVTIQSNFIGYGSKGGGTLSLTAPVFEIGEPADVAPRNFLTVNLDPSLFSAGFARYVVNGTAALDVLPGTQVTVAEPIYLPSAGLAVPTGGDPSTAYTVALLPLYTPTRGTDTLTQRPGASIALLSSIDPDHTLNTSAAGGPLTLGAGSAVAVDPDQSITLAAFGQLTVLGTLTAHGGTIAVANTRYDSYSSPPLTVGSLAASEFLAGVSVWIGGGSILDVSGQAEVQTDPSGFRFGQAGGGGTIALGGYDVTNTALSTWAQVIVRPGATLDADGSQAEVDVIPDLVTGTLHPQAHPVTLAGAGGAISARSFSGVALDGTLLAHAGAPDVAGGSLSVQIDPINLNAYNNIPEVAYQPREVEVTQNTVPVQAASLLPGALPAPSTYGLARLSQQLISDAGFNDVTLGAEGGAVAFGGNVSLSAARSITLNTGIVGDTSQNDSVSIAAPHVTLAGYTEAADAGSGDLAPVAPAFASFSTLTVQAALIDIGNLVDFGGTEKVNKGALLFAGPTTHGFGAPQGPVETGTFSFEQANFDSTGDIRFDGISGPGPTTGQLINFGNIALTAAQLYPTGGKATQVVAGYNPDFSTSQPLSVGGVIAVQGLGGALPQAPYSVGGTLSLVASTITQAGIIRAPEGVITLSDGDSPTAPVPASQINLMPGSITSVSLAGQTIPYGGTVDGVTYLAPNGTPAGLFSPQIQLNAQSVTVQDGATVDLRGGGLLTGAGFVFGRGGSADVLKTPLLDTSGGAAVANAAAQVAAIQAVNTGDPVYAILPGYQSAYAPALGPGDSAYTATQPGEQVTIGSGLPGLPAGTYTLLPAYYALLPGGYRVELTSGTVPLGSVLQQGNFTSAAPVTVSFANTGLATPVASTALLTSGTDVRQLSQYNEEDYATFETASATQFGAPRPFLPQDAKTLFLNYPNIAGTGPALSFAPSALLKTPGSDGYGATVEVAQEPDGKYGIDVAGVGDVPDRNALVLQAGVLSGLDAPRLVIGGTLAPATGSPSVIDVLSNDRYVDVLPHAVLTAGEVLLVTNQSGQITVAPGGTISTIGAGPAAYDVSNGFLFNADVSSNGAYPVLDLSNGRINFLPNTDASANAGISVGAGSTLLAGGSLDVVAPNTTVVTIGDASLGAKYASISVAAINIGSTASLAALFGQLPAGISFTPSSLQTLLAGDAALGIPAATELTLTATQEVNLVGSVALNSGVTDIVLNTPAIYGVGTAGDTASIVAPGFTWNGVGAVSNGAIPLNISALPGGQVAAGLGTTSGALNVQSSGPIVLGYGPQTQANDQVQLDRVVAGFTNVTLQSATEVTANNKSSLSVYATQTVYGQPGTGGKLSLLAPLITTDAAAVLKLTAGGQLVLGTPAGLPPSSTAAISTLGGEIDLSAPGIALATAIALPSGQFSAIAQGSIGLQTGGTIDLAGRTVHLLDQTVYSPGGSLTLESTAGNIAFATGSGADVSSPGSAAGAISLKALAGDVNLDGSLAGSAIAGQTAGSFSVVAGTLSATSTLPAAGVFGAVNQALDTGGFAGARSFEIGLLANGQGATTPDIVIASAADGTALLAAHTISVAADLGSIDIAGLIDASGTGPGSISLSALGNVTLEAGAVVDAHATVLAADSTGAAVDAENRAHVTLTTTAGSLQLLGGTVDLSSLDPVAQGQLVLNAPRVGTGDVAITASAPVSVLGAQSIALYGWRAYAAQDAAGTIVQGTGPAPIPAGAITLAQIDADNAVFMSAAGTNTALAARLTGLSGYGSSFHVRPGVEIDSSKASGGNLTIAGDLDFSTLRYSDVGYGLAVVPGIAGSGEPGGIVFRASNDLIVNGSISDGFVTPSTAKADYLPADDGWLLFSGRTTPLAADLVLPSGSLGLLRHQVTTPEIELGVGTTFSVDRAVSLNYPITIKSASVGPGTVIPFEAGIETVTAIDGTPTQTPVIIPAGGFVSTAAITFPDGRFFQAGTYFPGGSLIPIGSAAAAGSVFPIAVQVVGVATSGKSSLLVIPAGTLLSTFSSKIRLAAATAPLPADAFLPSSTIPFFVGTNGKPIPKVELRPAVDDSGDKVQGYLYALSAMLPAGSQSWSLDLVAGANTASADRNAVLPRSQLETAAEAVPNTAYQEPGSLILDDQHELDSKVGVDSLYPAFSVIRTGTGDLSLLAGGDIDQSSLYGIYTAGTQDPLPGGAAANAPYDLKREPIAAGRNKGFIAPGKNGNYVNRIFDQDYQAYYPAGGGDVAVAAGGSLAGDLFAVGQGSAKFLPSDAVGNWLWRQGGKQLGQSTAWWINFGTFAIPYSAGDTSLAAKGPQLVGFQGIGALGGGNVTVSAALDAGQMTDRSASSGGNVLRSEGLAVAVASTGRVVSTDGTLSTVLTGGGDLTVRIGGTLNPLDAAAYGLADQGNLSNGSVNGSLIDVRGNITVIAGGVGRLDTSFPTTLNPAAPDPRPIDPYTPTYSPNGGITVVPGDGTVSISTMRDVVLDGAGDPGRVTEQSLTRVTSAKAGGLSNPGGATGFSLWTSGTAINLFSSGGNATPVYAPLIEADATIVNDAATDGRIVYPSRLRVVAATGDISYGDPTGMTTLGLEIAPSPAEQVSFLAGTSITANGFAIDLSGADPASLSNPDNPAFSPAVGAPGGTVPTSIRVGAGTTQSPLALFALAPDTPTTSYLNAQASAAPALFYAAAGDIMNFVTGETLTFPAGTETLSTWYLAAKPVRIVAARDIVDSGTRPTDVVSALQQNQLNEGVEYGSGDLFLNTTPQSVSVVSAGRDILSGYVYVGGPGILEVDAGRNISQIGDATGTTQLLAYGSIKSLGSLQTGAPISLTGGAGVSVLAGLGSGPDYTAFADLYLNAANQANLALPITDPSNAGRVQQTYATQLLTWLQANYGYTGTQSSALDTFLNTAVVPAASQDAFLRNIFYAELLASGQQFNDPTSRFDGSYVRGQLAINTLLPGDNSQRTATTGASAGVPEGYIGAITMASGTLYPPSGMGVIANGAMPIVYDAGVATEHGGDVSVLVPGGDVVLGTSGGVAPGGGTGLITNGFGNIDVFAKDSVLLGQSRIFTNAGGNIQIWSAEGDINAGIGARTTIVYSPPVLSYDNTGGLVESPAIPTSGAGIATQQPLPTIAAGNIDLTAPQGTIDAGEAGVRSSGNINLAALHLANTAGIVAQGKTTGEVTAPSISASVAQAAGAAAGAATNAAQETLHPRSKAEEVASEIDVEVISIGAGGGDDQKRKRKLN